MVGKEKLTTKKMKSIDEIASLFRRRDQAIKELDDVNAEIEVAIGNSKKPAVKKTTTKTPLKKKVKKSTDHPSKVECPSCGLEVEKLCRDGVCRKCYSRNYYENNKKKKNPVDSVVEEKKYQLECLDCGKKWGSDIDPNEQKQECPKCGSKINIW